MLAKLSILQELWYCDMTFVITDLLQSLCKEKTLLHVVMGWDRGVNISDARKTSLYSAVFFQSLRKEKKSQ